MKGDRIYSETVEAINAVQTEATLFGEEPVVEKKANGRDAELIAQRNEHIMYRYHYYITAHGYNWPKTMGLLSQQFYLSEVTIGKIVQENGVLRRQIINANPSVKEMGRKFLVF